MALGLKTLKAPPPQECFVPSLIENGPEVPKKINMWKVYDDDTNNEDR